MRFETRLIPLRPPLDFRAGRRKKVLALVLAMAMSLSLAVTAGAAFNDQDKIVNTEAVDMCSALNIINGYTDGSFKPEGNVTRAEAAKMITIALNGGKEPTLSASSTPTYSDIAGHWAAKYIEYCTSLGIVAGDGAGKFNPNGNVKAVELAKMLLIAIGYSADAEKFVGANWDTNVNVVASQKDLYEELESIDPSVAATRDTAAQMVWNALNILMVEYDYKLTTVNGTLTSELVVKDIPYTTLLTKKFDTKSTEGTTGIMTGASYNTTKEEYTYTVQALTADHALAAAQTYVTEADYTALIGHNVTFVVENDNDVYGAFTADSIVLASGIVGDIDVATYANNTIEIADVEYDVDADVTGIKIGVANHAYTWTKLGSAADLTNATIVAPYDTFTAIDWDDDADIDLIAVVPVVLKDVSYVGSDYVKFSGDANKYEISEEDWAAYEGIEKEDVVIVSGDASLKTLGTISELEVQTGKVSAVKAKTAVIGGETYNFTQVATNATMKTTYLDQEIEFYVVNGYLVKEITTDTSVSVSDFAVVTDAVSSAAIGGTYDVELLYADGTTEVVKGAAPYTSLIGKMVKFDEDDGKYTLTEVVVADLADFDAEAVDQTRTDNVANGIAGAWSKAASASDADAKIGGYKIAADAVVFVFDGEDYTVETGATVSKVTDDNAKVFAYGADKNATNAYYVSFAFVQTSGVSASDIMYGYVVSEVSSIKDSDGEYETATVWNGSESVELTTDNGITFAGATEGRIIAYKLNAEGAVSYVATVDSLGGVLGTLTIIDGDDLTINGNPYEIDEDTVILYVDASEKEAATNGSLNVADEAPTASGTGILNGYFTNVYVYNQAGTDSAIELLVVDIDNDWMGVQ